MIASLPMYDRAETAAALDRLWEAIRDNDPDLPDRLSRPTRLWEHWLDPDLALSQCCGLPYRTVLHRQVTLVCTLDHGLPGCPPGHYNSVFVMRADDRRRDPAAWPALRLVYNSRASQSGWAAPQTHLAALGLPAFSRVTSTGAHRASARAVAKGAADIACIDAQSWRMIRRWDGALADALAEIARTTPTPGLPLVTARPELAARLARATARAVRALSAADRETLDLCGTVQIPHDAYMGIPTPAPPPEDRARLA